MAVNIEQGRPWTNRRKHYIDSGIAEKHSGKHNGAQTRVFSTGKNSLPGADVVL
ncbi:MAG: hypothetical protein WC552_09315 [Candidatus Omnitrophota bacterium]